MKEKRRYDIEKSPVLKLQDLATSVDIEVEELLLKGKLIASKLNLENDCAWFHNELNGYSWQQTLPDYRIKHALQVKSFDTALNRWIPVVVDNFFEFLTPDYVYYTTENFNQSVSMLQQYARKNDDVFYLDLREHMADGLKPFLDHSYRISWALSPAVFSQMLTNIRSEVLDWALNLERNNIFGEGLWFSPEEKRDAQNVTYHNTINNHGNGMAVIGRVDSEDSVIGGTVSNIEQQKQHKDLQRP